jgi:hypothetical protein
MLSSSSRIAVLIGYVLLVVFATNVDSYRTRSNVGTTIRSSPAIRSRQSIVSHQQPLIELSASKQDAPIVKQDMTMKEQLQNIWTNYRYTGLALYITLYITVLSTIFISLDLDILQASKFGVNPVDAIMKVCSIIETLTGNSGVAGFIRENPKWGTFAIAWVMCKLTEPIRLGITVAALPTVAKLLGKGPTTTPII